MDYGKDVIRTLADADALGQWAEKVGAMPVPLA